MIAERLSLVRATENHGPYIEEEITGQTVCDFYTMQESKALCQFIGEEPINFDNAENNAAEIVRRYNAHPRLVAALEAIQARIRGEFDDPALVAFGALGAADSDCLAILDNALKGLKA